MTGDSDQVFIFDQLDQLVRVDGRNSNLEEGYLYDVSGRLTGKLDSRATLVEVLVHDGVQMIESFGESGDLNWSATWGPGIDNLISLTTPTGGDDQEIFTLQDGRANIVGWASGTDATLVARAEYTPEGRGKYATKTGNCEETDSTRCVKPLNLPFGFHSAYSSSNTGLVYFRNRWYSPEAAQWLSRDPLGNVDSFNLYAFNAFDPVNYVDPFGLESTGLSANGCGDIGQPACKTDYRTSVHESARDANAWAEERATIDMEHRGRTGRFGTKPQPDFIQRDSARPKNAWGRAPPAGERPKTAPMLEPDAGVKRRKVLLLIAKKIDILNPEHPQYGQDMRRVVKQFDKKLVQALVNADALVQPVSMGQKISPIRDTDDVRVVSYDGTKIPNAPDTEVVIFFGHADADSDAILPSGGDLTNPVRPDNFSAQVKSAVGKQPAEVWVLGCDSEANGFADGTARALPQSHVYGASGNVSTGYESTESGKIDPSTPLDIGMEIYDTRN